MSTNSEVKKVEDTVVNAQDETLTSGSTNDAPVDLSTGNGSNHAAGDPTSARDGTSSTTKDIPVDAALNRTADDPAEFDTGHYDDDDEGDDDWSDDDMSGLAPQTSTMLQPKELSPHKASDSHTLHPQVLPPVLKKKHQNADFDSLFDDMEIMEDALPPPKKPAGPKGTNAPSPSTGRKTAGLSPEERKAKFDGIAEFVQTRTARNLAETRPAVRDSAWVQMLQLATTEEELGRVVELMPAWKENRGRVFTSAYSEAFARRCHELACPLLALQVYGNYARYNLPLTLPSARQLLYSLHSTHPIGKLMTASALYGLYALPAAAQDYVSCAIIVSGCLADGSEDARRIAEALVPHLRELQRTEREEELGERERVWVREVMRSVERRLGERKGGDLAAAAAASSSAAPEQTVSA
ncbi:hypothetical protein MD484_g3699, partial [Candolleomyces efflorescens]